MTRVKFPGFLKASRRGGEAEVSPGGAIAGVRLDDCAIQPFFSCGGFD